MKGNTTMVQSLLLAKILVSLLVCFLTLAVFRGPFEDLAIKALTLDFWNAWKTLIYLSVYVMGLSRGVLVDELERFTRFARTKKDRSDDMSRDEWILEVTKTVIESLKAIALMLLLFLAVASIILLIRMKFSV